MKIIKVPINYGALEKKEGQEYAPQTIVDNLKNYYLKENGLLPVLEIDEVTINNSDIDSSNQEIEKKAYEQDSPAIFIGGDHSMTYSTFKGLYNRSDNPGLLIFDAHLDCTNNFSPPTHEDFLRVLIEEKIVKPENVIIVGARNFHPNELNFVKKNKVKIFDMREISRSGKEEVCNSFMSVAKNFKKLYVSVDIDVLDPAFAPGTGYTEPGGLTTRELLYFIQRLKSLKNIELMDLVEVNPSKDINNLTVSVASKLIMEMS
ncbi:arginase family protein [archaeon]|mgnify:FL=1|jgi:arginase family enzyme|nr:arginase family protein [archaeon]MBT6822442.1 arginase family protein [archaeon]MBT7392108.1 arginase family protein [archaeon]